MENFLIVAVAVAIIISLKQRKTLAHGLGNLGMAMPNVPIIGYVGGGLCLLIIGGLVWWFWDDLDFATMLAISLVILISGHLFRTSKTDDLKKALPYYLGVAAVAAVLWFNGAGSAAKSGLNAADTYAEEVVATGRLFEGGCPSNEAFLKVGQQYTLKRGCGPIKVIGDLPSGFTYQVTEGAFAGTFEDHIKIDRPYTNIRTFSLGAKAPDEIDSITFQVIGAEESTALDAAEAALAEAKASGFKPPAE